MKRISSLAIISIVLTGSIFSVVSSQSPQGSLPSSETALEAGLSGPLSPPETNFIPPSTPPPYEAAHRAEEKSVSWWKRVWLWITELFTW